VRDAGEHLHGVRENRARLCASVAIGVVQDEDAITQAEIEPHGAFGVGEVLRAPTAARARRSSSRSDSAPAASAAKSVAVKPGGSVIFANASVAAIGGDCLSRCCKERGNRRHGPRSGRARAQEGSEDSWGRRVERGGAAFIGQTLREGDLIPIMERRASSRRPMIAAQRHAAAGHRNFDCGALFGIRERCGEGAAQLGEGVSSGRD
jgi:hypothetical protein